MTNLRQLRLRSAPTRQSRPVSSPKRLADVQLRLQKAVTLWSPAARSWSILRFNFHHPPSRSIIRARVMGQTLRKMKKRPKDKKKKVEELGEACDFEEDSTSSWVSTLPTRHSTMSCPTDESSTYSVTHSLATPASTTAKISASTPSQSAEPSKPISTLTANPYCEFIEDEAKQKVVSVSLGLGTAPSQTTSSTPNPFPPSIFTGDSVELSSRSCSRSTCRSSNTSADYSELQSIGYSSQPGEVHMYESDFEWIEAVEAFLTDEVIRRSASRRPVLAVRGKKPSGFAQNYRSLYRNLMNKKVP
uniref:EPL1 domain-containing protein n=1 Tax=Steinernema glaseri TaxID=37863 RepID=A0A1I7YUR9_9BILA